MHKTSFGNSRMGFAIRDGDMEEIQAGLDWHCMDMDGSNKAGFDWHSMDMGGPNEAVWGSRRKWSISPSGKAEGAREETKQEEDRRFDAK